MRFTGYKASCNFFKKDLFSRLVDQATILLSLYFMYQMLIYHSIKISFGTCDYLLIGVRGLTIDK